MLQHGAYTLLLDACYDREIFPTLEQAIDWCWASTQDEKDAVEFVIKKFFVLVDGIYIQHRIQDELDQFHSNSKTNQRIAIEREAKKRTKREQESTKRGTSVNEPTTDEHERAPNHKPLTINHKPITNNQKHKSKKFNPSVDMWSDWGFPAKPSEEIFNAWLTMRRDKKYTVSELSFKGIGSGLRDAVQSGFTVDQCLTKAEGNSWKGFSASWMINSQSSARPSYQAAQPSQQGFLDGDFIDGEVISG